MTAEKLTLDYYAKNSGDFIASTRNVDMSSIQNQFISLLPQNARILDLGCGSGRDSLYFLQKGFSVDAADACPEFCKSVKNLTGEFLPSKKITVIQMQFSELSAVQKYDGIWACSSLLHVPKSELPLIFKKIQNALKPNGIFYCSFKQGTFEGERNGRYFSDFTQDELCSMIHSSTKLKAVKIWLTQDARPERSDSWINALWRLE